ncbi:flagellar protein FlgN [Pseudalkalibacillus decolorationis]|uniref:flagellar protein FlgN n=1 Tax=Pseudalkalibacillus decolorationis TaxID=163879 RepID=UPI0021494DBE|nr:flagellar protein FlgN [Pseudalkalibacillus decolorationis]
MNAERMVGLLSDLQKAHEQLLGISVQKTDALKQNDISKLDTLLKEEEKSVQSIEKVENERVAEVEALLKGQGIIADNSPSLSQIIRFYNVDDQERLEKSQEELRETIGQLRKQNELNHDLTRQSLQFVNASLSLMGPKQPATYERTGQANNTNNYGRRQSMFDSKA